MSTDLLSLWGAIQRGDMHAIASHIFPPSTKMKCTPIPEPTEDLVNRFLANVAKRETGCHEWTGHTTEGYGGLNINGKGYRAHRVSYRFFVGPIPDGLMVLHKCDNTRCVNPDHLFVGTALDNVRDMIAKGRDSFGEPKEFCSRGHKFSEVGKSKSGGCAQCNRERALAYYHAHKSPEPQQPMPGSPALVEGSSPTADAGTAGVGTPIVRFWTVRFERGGRSYYDRVEAPDACMASRVTLLRNVGAVCAETVCEITRAEYDRFTRRSP